MKNNELGNRLKTLRASKAEKLGRPIIPQREVAKQLDVTSGAYASWETGRNKPDVDNLKRISEYFEVSIDDLLGNRVTSQADMNTFTNKKGLIWKVNKEPETENEEKGIEIWKRLTHGESYETIVSALKARTTKNIKRYLLDAIYSDLISIVRLPSDEDNLAKQVREAFGLRDVIVVSLEQDSPSLYSYILLGEAARNYLLTNKDDVFTKVGIAGGYAVSRLVYSLKQGDCSSMEIYPLATCPVLEAVALDANSLVGAWAYRHFWHNVRGYFLPYTSNSLIDGDKKSIDPVNPTWHVLDRAKDVDIVFMGIGPVKLSRQIPLHWLNDILKRKGLDVEKYRERLHERGAVGDILYHLVNKNGEPIDSEISNYVCSIGLKDLRRMVQQGGQDGVRVVVIASGHEKREITQAAIKGGYLNVLIIDDELARALLGFEQVVS